MLKKSMQWMCALMLTTVSYSAFALDDWCRDHPYDVVCGFPGSNDNDRPVIYDIPHVANNPYHVTCSSSFADLQNSAYFDIRDYWMNVYPNYHSRGLAYDIWFYVQTSDNSYAGPWFTMVQGNWLSDANVSAAGYVLLVGPNSISDKLWIEPHFTHHDPLGCAPL